MSSNIIVSVVIPTLNQEKFIGRCLRSLLDQSLERKKYELITIDDGSEDKTSSILKLFRDEVKIIKNKKNMGLPHSINQGILSARGRFIVRVDSDDYVNREFLNLLQMFLTANVEINAVCCDYFLVDDKENIIDRKNSSTHPIGCGIMFKVEDLIDLGMYDESFHVHEDQDLRLRFLKKYKINRISLPLYRYRKHEGNITSKKKNMRKHYARLKKKHKIKKNI